MVNNTKDLRKKVYYNNATYYYLVECVEGQDI